MNIRMAHQRGSIIIYAMLTMSAMLAIGLTLSGLFIGKLRSAANARNSTIAIYAADSAVEKCLYEARQQPADGDKPSLTFEYTGADYEIRGTDEQDGAPTDGDITADCRSLNTNLFNFKATGIYRGVRRTLEITQ